MDDEIRTALEQGGICDITTIGRRSGRSHRIEMYFHNLDGELLLSGRPGFPRDWLANLRANPTFTLHLKRGVTADLDATATEITDPDRRAEWLFRIFTESWGRTEQEARASLDVLVDSAPLVRFALA